MIQISINNCIIIFIYIISLNQHNNDGECHLTFIISKYEDDIVVNKLVTYNYFMEIGYLFLEVDTDRKILLDPQMNHIGLGVAASN